MTELPEGLDDWRNWDAESRKKAARALQKAMEGDSLAWYCKRGRKCDGKPHDEYDYPHARGDQWPPAGVDWFLWLVMSGRGAGKTRTGSEWVRKITSRVPRIALVGRRGKDVRGTMVEGRSGLIRICERAGMDYEWQPSKKEFTFENGAKAFGYSAEEPDELRGPEHGAAWLDEPAHMPLIEAVWDNLLMGLRIDGLPGGAKVLCTTTPLPVKWVKERMAEEGTRLVRVPTYVNLDNLDPQFRKNIIEKYEGTRKGRQELYGEILEDVEGALWNWDMIEGNRNLEIDPKSMQRIVVGIDPAGTSKGRDETGIVVVGFLDGHLYVLADYSGHMTPNGWARAAWNAYDFFEADAIVAEKNYGGEMVRSTLRNVRSDGNVKMVNSRRGKLLRAEPIVALYEQAKVHHVSIFEDLEAQMTEWVPDKGDSPDRVDALVHAATELAKPGEGANIASPVRRTTTPSGLPAGLTTRRAATLAHLQRPSSGLVALRSAL